MWSTRSTLQIDLGAILAKLAEHSKPDETGKQEKCRAL
jgi:hypothetical protein